MTEHVIQIIANAAGFPCPFAGEYLMTFDHEAHDGRGEIDTTTRLSRAMKFKTSIKAFEFYGRVSKSRPTRPDGKPNKPLTAFTVLITKVEP